MCTAIKLTPKRLKALRMIQQRPRMRAAGLIEICDTINPSWLDSGKEWNGFAKARGNQAATRWAAGYVKPLVDAGLVKVNQFIESGWGELELTPEGHFAVRNAVDPDKRY